MDVSDPDAFIVDPDALAAATIAVADLLGVPPNIVHVTLTKAARRLRQTEASRRLATGSVIVSYTILFPPDVSASVTDAVVSAVATTNSIQLTSLVNQALAQATGSSSAYTVTVTSLVAPRVQVGTMGGLGIIATTVLPTTTATTTTTTSTTMAPPLDSGGMNTGAIAGVVFAGTGLVVAVAVLGLLFGKKVVGRGADIEKVIEIKDDKDKGKDAKDDEHAGGLDTSGGAWPMPPGATPLQALEVWDEPEQPVALEVDTRKQPASQTALRVVSRGAQLPPLPPWVLEEGPPKEGDDFFWRWAREAVVGLREAAQPQPGGTASPANRVADSKRNVLVQRWQAPTVPIPTAGSHYTLPGEMPPPELPSMVPASIEELPLQMLPPRQKKTRVKPVQ